MQTLATVSEKKVVIPAQKESVLQIKYIPRSKLTLDKYCILLYVVKYFAPFKLMDKNII